MPKIARENENSEPKATQSGLLSCKAYATNYRNYLDHQGEGPENDTTNFIIIFTEQAQEPKAKYSGPAK